MSQSSFAWEPVPHPVFIPPTEKNTDTCQESAEAKHNPKKQRHPDTCELPWAQPGLRFHLRLPDHEGTPWQLLTLVT